MQLRYVFSELRQGLRRNLSMHIAVVLTLFVSLALVGAGVLLNQQASRLAEQWGNELEITVYLCRDRDQNPACTSAVTDDQRAAIQTEIDENPEVESSRAESQEEFFERVKELYGEEDFEGPYSALTAEDLSDSIWITLKNPKEYEGITSAVIGLDGVSSVQDLREVIGPIVDTIDGLQTGALIIAGVLVLAALLLVANTIRLAAFARRKEIAIMRLVGASTLYITLPFLLEALVTAAIGVLLAGGAIAALMYWGIQENLVDSVRFISWVDWPEYLNALAVVAIVGPVLTLLPTLLLTRKYLKV